MTGSQRDAQLSGNQCGYFPYFSDSLLLMKDCLAFSIVLSLETCVCVQDLCSPQAPGCLQHQMSSYHRQSKSGKRAGRTSEEHPAACSSAISAWESSYKKHLLHFVLSMMLWKINTVMVFLPLFSLSSRQSMWVSICLHANVELLHVLFVSEIQICS